MRNQEFEKRIQPLLDECKKQGDHYVVVHFSKVDDHFVGMEQMDFTDALIVIDNLIKNHKLNPQAVAAMQGAN